MPTAIEVSDFRTRFTEFSEVADSFVSLAIDDAEFETDLATWGGSWPMAVTWLSAHFVATRYDLSGNPLSAAANQVQTGRTVDKTSVTFADPGGLGAGSDAILATTRYGQEFLRLRRRVIPSSFVAA